MSYRPSKFPPKGAWARHLHEQRRARDLSQTQAFEFVYERVGWSPKSRTAYVAIDMGDRQPKDGEAAVLAAEFGWPPEPQTADEPPPDTAALVSVVGKLLAELRAERAERAEWSRGVVESIRELAKALSQSDALGRAPRATVPK